MSIQDLKALIERAERVFVAKPEAAVKQNPHAVARIVDGVRCEITGPEGERATSDMPQALGGTGSAPVPGWYLRAAMAACNATAIQMRAARMGVALERLEVSVHSRSDARGLLGMNDVSAALSDLQMTVTMAAREASPEQLRELARWGDDHSPVGSTLRAGPAYEVVVEIAPPSGQPNWEA
ncbi:OsmC family protein [Burkholderiaceae bacterium FT117]|uniref:OsmC family protein n=1 Tax=Zeimonas sediminis TaxID=2944268 RepID=UPI002342F1E2|nr:OsmC family protein [Zeimonas sediminis]MCM5571232.1 OsmC family protein [Zeimonas sediminis]